MTSKTIEQRVKEGKPFWVNVVYVRPNGQEVPSALRGINVAEYEVLPKAEDDDSDTVHLGVKPYVGHYKVEREQYEHCLELYKKAPRA